MVDLDVGRINSHSSYIVTVSVSSMCFQLIPLSIIKIKKDEDRIFESGLIAFVKDAFLC